MKTLIIQSFRRRDIPGWIARCLASVGAWARTRNYDYRLTDDTAFALCGEDYLAKVGDNKRSITNLCRLELIRAAHAEGYDRAVWVDADVLVFAPDRLDWPHTRRICFARETWVAPVKNGLGWTVNQTLNNCLVLCPRGDPDLDFIIHATRHRARHLPVRHNFQVGVELIRGLHQFMQFPLVTNVGMLSNFVLMALAQKRTDVLGLQATYHRAPIHAANICASDHLSQPVPEATAHIAMDLLEQTAGDIINGHLPPVAVATGPAGSDQSQD
jgi:hypothetical protein